MGKATVYTIGNQKGGVGKTTSCIELSAGLQLKGYKVLLVDADSQGDLSFSLRANTEGNTLKEVLQGKCSAKDAIQHTEGGDIIASKPTLAGADMWLESTLVLRKALEPLKKDYDFIIIDTPRALAKMALNAFAVSDKVIITATTEAYTINATKQIYDTVNYIKETANPALEIAGILLCMYDNRANICKDLENLLREDNSRLLEIDKNIKVFDTVIHKAKHIQEASLLRKDVFSHAPNCRPAVDYMQFIDELLKRDK